MKYPGKNIYKKQKTMKLKIITFYLLLIVITFSCKKEEISNLANTDGVLLVQVIIDDQPYSEYIYNTSNLISQEKSSFDISVYQYNDKNLLSSTGFYTNYDILSSDPAVSEAARTETNWITPDNSNNSGTMNYEYNNNDQLIKATYTPLTGSSQYSKFSYDADSRIKRQIIYWGDIENGYIDYSYDINGNLTEEDLYEMSSTGSEELSTTTIYEFDNKNNPYKSVTRLMTPGVNTNPNNIVKETYTIYANDVQMPDNVQIAEFKYVYNNQGYPVSKNGNIKYVYR